MYAVGSDQHVGRGGDRLAVTATAQRISHLPLVLLERFEGMAGMDLVRAQALLGDAVQDHVQFAAMDRELRPVVAGGTAARLAPDRLPELVVIGQRRGFDGAAGQVFLQPEFRQFLDRVRQ